MSFHKVVKAPAKRAHIKNFPHKKSEERDRRVKWLWDYTKSLLGVILVNSGYHKFHFYEQWSAVKQELKELGCYDERNTWLIISDVKWEHNRFYQW